ncbi:hypothetical protein SLS60_007292 [Paraconiothyrium brasiliense]|uniref:Uncharacterized protein n=1 Tax=Paraconiothyrium brasiliense TaxID=300254 RepID=A0ABR3R5R4_9PLEO
MLWKGPKALTWRLVEGTLFGEGLWGVSDWMSFVVGAIVDSKEWQEDWQEGWEDGWAEPGEEDAGEDGEEDEEDGEEDGEESD